MISYDISPEKLKQVLKDLRRYGGTPAADQNQKENAADIIEALINKIDELEGR